MTYNKQKFTRSLHKGIKIHKGLVAGTRCGLCGKPIPKRDIDRYMAGNLKVCKACFNREGKPVKVAKNYGGKQAYTTGELFGGAVPSNVKDIFNVKKETGGWD